MPLHVPCVYICTMYTSNVPLIKYTHFAEIYFNITGNLAEKCPFRILGLMSFFDLYLFFPSYHITVIQQQPFHLSSSYTFIQVVMQRNLIYYV